MSVGTKRLAVEAGREVVGDGVGVGKGMTVEEFLALSQREEYADKRLELDEGRLIIMPPAGDLHGTQCATIVALLVKYIESSGLGRVSCNDPGLILGRNPDTVRAPDVVYYRENVSWEAIPRGLAERLPQLVVEVVSPTDRPNEVVRKVQQYLRAGIAMVWVVDPEDRTVGVYRGGREPQVLGEGEVLSGEEVLPGFSVAVAELFRLPGTCK
uniref:Hypothetical conserved protein n=1 Tax=uncultured Planctomycetota bacterium TaxID=120965 RepID=H5SCC5_9BACT|nr:hypothetical conserved protein [uncultured Planctomycetota bacterium]